jgi:hypothetical protein
MVPKMLKALRQFAMVMIINVKMKIEISTE